MLHQCPDGVPHSIFGMEFLEFQDFRYRADMAGQGLINLRPGVSRHPDRSDVLVAPKDHTVDVVKSEESRQGKETNGGQDPLVTDRYLSHLKYVLSRALVGFNIGNGNNLESLDVREGEQMMHQRTAIADYNSQTNSVFSLRHTRHP